MALSNWVSMEPPGVSRSAPPSMSATAPPRRRCWPPSATASRGGRRRSRRWGQLPRRGAWRPRWERSRRSRPVRSGEERSSPAASRPLRPIMRTEASCDRSASSRCRASRSPPWMAKVDSTARGSPWGKVSLVPPLRPVGPRHSKASVGRRPRPTPPVRRGLLSQARRTAATFPLPLPQAARKCGTCWYDVPEETPSLSRR